MLYEVITGIFGVEHSGDGGGAHAGGTLAHPVDYPSFGRTCCGKLGRFSGNERTIKTMAREIVARYWQPTSAETGELVCTLCPHHCRMLPSETGRCGARGNAAGRLALLTWGLSSGFCIDSYNFV